MRRDVLYIAVAIVIVVGGAVYFAANHSRSAAAPKTPAPAVTPSPTVAASPGKRPYTVVGTGVTTFYDNLTSIPSPRPTSPFYAQDAAFQTNEPSYTDNGDGTVTDNRTGLMWQKDMGEEMTLAQAEQEAASSHLAGHSDWRVPTIKELYSLINFTGQADGQRSVKLFIDTTYFDQPLGGNGTAVGERQIDAQTLSCTRFGGLTMGGDHSIFGVNFIDGRLKAYPTVDRATGQPMAKYFRLVRGATSYGKNDFVAHGDGTVTDLATGLMWQQADSGRGMDWEHALTYARDLTLAGHDDWRLPNAKELQSIVDYARAPETTDSPAIDPIFKTTKISDPDGRPDYPYFWTGTTHLDGPDPGREAVYIAFGEALGRVHGQIVDAHGAGAQRSDPKTGDAADYPLYFGPQGDLRRVFNFVRAVRSVGRD